MNDTDRDQTIKKLIAAMESIASNLGWIAVWSWLIMLAQCSHSFSH